MTIDYLEFDEEITLEGNPWEDYDPSNECDLSNWLNALDNEDK